MTIFGYDIPLIGPVLQSIYDPILPSGIGVNAAGNAVAISIGAVSIQASANVLAAGTPIALSAGAMHRPTYALGNPIGVSTGGASVNTDNDATVGVSGAVVSISIGAVLITTTTNVFPTGIEISLDAGMAVTPQSTNVFLVGTPLAITAGSPGINSFIPLVRSFDPTTANLSGSISDLVIEDDYDLERDIPGVPSGSILVEAWLTIKEGESDDDVDAVVQKAITAAPAASIGQITDAGGSGTAHLIFQIGHDETDLLLPDRVYFYDIQVKTNTGKYSTREKGTLIPNAQVTDSL